MKKKQRIIQQDRTKDNSQFGVGVSLSCYFLLLLLFFPFPLVSCRASREKKISSSVFIRVCFVELFFFSLFSFPLVVCAAICKYGHELGFGNFQVLSVGCEIIVCSNRFLFLCLHFHRHLHTKSCSARILS